MNRIFSELLSDMQELHAKKSHDYAAENDPYSNFKRAAHIAKVPVDTVFKVMLGIKMARIEELMAAHKDPLNESLDDSFKDLCVYTCLWASWHRTLDQIAVGGLQ